MNPTIRVKVPFTGNIETFNLVGQGAYPYDCTAKDKHPHSLIYERESGGWIASHQLTDTNNGYYILH